MAESDNLTSNCSVCGVPIVWKADSVRPYAANEDGSVHRCKSFDDLAVCDTPKIGDVCPSCGDVCPSCGKGTVYKMNWAALNCDYCHTEWSRVGGA